MASKKSALGRGLDALIGAEKKDAIAEVTQKPERKTQAKRALPQGLETDENGTLWADPKLLKPNPHQPRETFSPEQLEELASSIKEHGIIQPITIEDAGNGSFYIIAGERRVRAAISAGQKKVPVQLRKFNDEKKLEIALIENIQRADLNPVEEAKAYYNLMQLGGLNQEEVAKKVGKKRSTVANAIRLLKLPEDMQESLVNGSLTAGHARAILSVTNPGNQRILYKKILAGMSVREAENTATNLNNGEEAPKKNTTTTKTPPKDPDIAQIEQKFIDSLGTKVTLKGGLEKGSLIIEYFSREDLDRLYGIIIKE